MMNEPQHHRGVAIMLTNVGIPEDNTVFPYRKAGERDLDNMRAIFVHGFGFPLLNQSYYNTNVPVRRWNHKWADAKRQYGDTRPNQAPCCISCLVRNFDFRNVDTVLLYISTHGVQSKGELKLQFLSEYADEDTMVPIQEVVDLLSDRSCPTLKGKQRIVILQACRADAAYQGLAQDPGVTVNVASTDRPPRARGEDEDNAKRVADTCQSVPYPEVPQTVVNVPRNFMIVYPTTPYRFSKRNVETGSWFEHELRNAFNETREEVVDIFDLLTAANMKLAMRESKAFLKDNVQEGEVVYQRDAEGRRIPDQKATGMKNTMVIEHRLCDWLVFQKIQPRGHMNNMPAM